jgi:creatinine amidohydrolase
MEREYENNKRDNNDNENKNKQYSNILAEINAHHLREFITKNTTSAIAILIFGACENHGDHMPFGADFIMPFELSKRIASKYRNILVLPPLPYGVSSHHKDFSMTISLEPETMINIVRDILQSLVSNGIKHVLIINGHDGNIAPVEIASRIIKEKNPQLVIACLESWWSLVGTINKELFDVWNGLGHGGEAETSAMLAVRPDLVNMSLAPEQVVPKLPNEVRIYWKFKELTDTGATGAPRKATIEKGKKILDILENTLISFITAMDENDWKYGIGSNNKI